MKLHNYQLRAIKFILTTPRCSLWMSCGLGKSIATLKAIEQFTGPTLIVAPKRVVETVWEQEAIKWNVPLTFTRLTGTPKQRSLALSRKTDVYLINYELLTWLRLFIKEDWFFENIVYDESSLLKSPGSKRTRTALALSNSPIVKRIIQLTATPASNGLEDIYAPMKVLDGGQRLGRNKRQFLLNYFYAVNPFSDYPSFAIRPDKEQVIYDNISDIVLSMTAEDYLEMPDLIINDIKVTLPPVAARQYADLKRTMLIEVADEKVLAVNAAVLVGKLAQLASGNIWIEGTAASIHDVKLDALADILEESSGAPVFIGYHYKHTLTRLRERFHVVDISDGDTDEIVRDWNRGEIGILTANYASAAHGLNLQAGGNIMVKFDPTYNLELDEQFTGRLHRQGQGKPVIIHRLIASGTIDEKIIEALSSKSSVQNLLLEGLK